uniref:Large ribosomal subunit protein bL32c n=3 Tax=Microsoroideae TaxID=2017694 RepID=A0A7M1YAZ1_9MONI|nr:ribosomal protein L32 [Lemmaphyllum intermedium]QKV46515.1 ribosomal protein L32 [Lemmaphyllum carnosum var. microphyllum]QOS49020.1 ribosomal protein L32 [Lemmaphyllum intermedium]UWK23971.1 ribosomal protein L32 [Lemmaphyllum carnosum var. drymoglossoides]
MAVPKKRTSSSKKKIRSRTWKAEPVKVASAAFSLAQSVLTGRSTSFYYVTEEVTGEKDSSKN